MKTYSFNAQATVTIRAELPEDFLLEALPDSIEIPDDIRFVPPIVIPAFGGSGKIKVHFNKMSVDSIVKCENEEPEEIPGAENTMDFASCIQQFSQMLGM